MEIIPVSTIDNT